MTLSIAALALGALLGRTLRKHPVCAWANNLLTPILLLLLFCVGLDLGATKNLAHEARATAVSSVAIAFASVLGSVIVTRVVRFPSEDNLQ